MSVRSCTNYPIDKINLIAANTASVVGLIPTCISFIISLAQLIQIVMSNEDFKLLGRQVEIRNQKIARACKEILKEIKAFCKDMTSPDKRRTSDSSVHRLLATQLLDNTTDIVTWEKFTLASSDNAMYIDKLFSGLVRFHKKVANLYICVKATEEMLHTDMYSQIERAVISSMQIMKNVVETRPQITRMYCFNFSMDDWANTAKENQARIVEQIVEICLVGLSLEIAEFIANAAHQHLTTLIRPLHNIKRDLLKAKAQRQEQKYNNIAGKIKTAIDNVNSKMLHMMCQAANDIMCEPDNRVANKRDDEEREQLTREVIYNLAEVKEPKRKYDTDDDEDFEEYGPDWIWEIDTEEESADEKLSKQEDAIMKEMGISDDESFEDDKSFGYSLPSLHDSSSDDPPPRLHDLDSDDDLPPRLLG